MTAPIEPLKLWVCLCCGETWKDTADLIPGGGGYGHIVSPEDLCGEVVEYAPVVARDSAAELRAAIREWAEATDALQAFELDQSNAYGTDHADAEARVEAAVKTLRALAATEGEEA